MTHRYVAIASEIAHFAPVEAAELATADASGMITSGRAGTASGRCPGRLALGRAVAIRDAAYAERLMCPTLQAAYNAAQAAEVTVERRQWRSGRSVDGAGNDINTSGFEVWTEVRTANEVAAARQAINAAIHRVEEEIAADPTISHWRKFSVPQAPKGDTLSDLHSVPASEWDSVKARWARLDALLKRTEHVDVFHSVYAVDR